MSDYNVNLIISGPNNEHPATYKTFILRGNTSFADQVTEPNTKYVIKWDFNLNGETVTVPENCIFEFDGGTLKNGTIIGQDTFYIDEGGLGDDVIFGNGIIKKGTWRKNEGCSNPDKPYDPTAHSGLGRKTFELKEGGSNVLTQEDFSDTNTIYVIRYDFTLGEAVTIPANCVLEFDGGSISGNTLELSSNITINGNGTSFVVPEHIQVIKAEGQSGIKIINCVFDCTHNTHRSYDYGGVFIKNCSDIVVKGCKFFGLEDGSAGRIGLTLFKCNDVVVEDNKFLNFYEQDYWNYSFEDGDPETRTHTPWATYFVSIKDAVIRNNSFVKTYSGIKLTGWIENIQISNNYSCDSITDGMDFAGISARNISICNNTFIRNNDNGVEFKILEVSGAHYDDTLNVYGYDMNTPRYFKDIVIANNTFTGHRSISMVNAFTKSQISELLETEKPYIFEDDNVGNICIANNTSEYIDSMTMLPDKRYNKHSSFCIFILLSALPQQNVVFEGNQLSGKFGLYIVSSTNLRWTKNVVSAVNTSIYFRKQPNRVLNYDNTIEGNQFVTKNGPYIGINVGEDENHNSVVEAYNNIFRNNRFLAVTYHREVTLMPDLPVYNQFTGNEYGKSWVSIDRRYTKDDGSPCSIPAFGTTFYRENGLAKGFQYFNTDTDKLNILKTVGSPVVVRYRITKVPERIGNITFSWTVDTIKREEGQNPSVTVNIDKVPASVEEFINLIAEQVKMSKWYMEMDHDPSSVNAIVFHSKEHYSYMTPPAPQYNTDTDAEFMPSYNNGEEESWISLSSSE